MNDPETFKNPCAICHQRQATRYCDYIIGYSNPNTFYRDYKLICGNNGPHYETCDVPMCDECAKNIGRELDFCPYHFEIYQKAKEVPAELRKAQARVKAEIIHEVMHMDD